MEVQPGLGIVLLLVLFVINLSKGMQCLSNFGIILYLAVSLVGVVMATYSITVFFIVLGIMALFFVWISFREDVIPSALEKNRFLAEPASAREIEENSERRSGVYTRAQEDSSTESTNKFSAEVGLCKKSNKWQQQPRRNKGMFTRLRKKPRKRCGVRKAK